MVNVRNVGAVNSGPNTASTLISEPGTGMVASGNIGGNPFHQRYPGTAGGCRTSHHGQRAAHA